MVAQSRQRPPYRDLARRPDDYAGPERATVWPYNGREGGGVDDDLITLGALREVLGR